MHEHAHCQVKPLLRAMSEDQSLLRIALRRADSAERERARFDLPAAASNEPGDMYKCNIVTYSYICSIWDTKSTTLRSRLSLLLRFPERRTPFRRRELVDVFARQGLQARRREERPAVRSARKARSVSDDAVSHPGS
jgi:hypothetical protein